MNWCLRYLINPLTELFYFRLLLEHGANVVALNNDCNIPIDICKSDEIRELFKQDIAAKGKFQVRLCQIFLQNPNLPF